MPENNHRLITEIAGITLENPIMSASGTYGSGKEYTDFLSLASLGAVVTKSVTLQQTKGNPPPRIVETPSGMLNAIGLQNEGLDYFLQELLPPLRQTAKRVIVNIAGKTFDEYIELAERLSDSGVDALEVNISCPNVREGGIAFGVCPDAAGKLTVALKKHCKKPLFVKLSPNVTDITIIAKAVEAAGADALVVANTFIGMAIDIEKRKPILANITGGLSGPCVHPLVLRLLWQVRQAVKCPLIAVGGVKSVKEVISYLIAGASAVQVGTMNFVKPDICAALVKDLGNWLEKHDVTTQKLINSLTK